jgi:uncharacterized repeat protein (TIGR03803 family)
VKRQQRKSRWKRENSTMKIDTNHSEYMFSVGGPRTRWIRAITLPTVLMVAASIAAAQPPVFRTLYSFTGLGDGASPSSLVIGGGGVLYGTTESGGSSNAGTVFSMTPPSSAGGSWTQTVLYNFTSVDGASASAIVAAESGGVLYGATYYGGSAGSCSGGCGTVFSLTPPASSGANWTETALYNFTGGHDGRYPNSLILKGGVLYGTTYLGGYAGIGVVFALRPPAIPGTAWTEEVLFHFAGFSEGGNPLSVAMGEGGVLYGTTGASNLSNGTVFSLAPPPSPGAWTHAVLYDSFAVAATPNYLAIGSGGAIYGTTVGGGTGSCDSGSGCGAVFSLTPPGSSGGAWTYTTLYSFTDSGDDGAYPYAGVAIGGGVLYGTTGLGGHGGNGYGTVYSLTPPASTGGAWTETVLHQFTGTGDGAIPHIGVVIGGGGLLYGATGFGGTGKDGTVYSEKP